MTTPVPVPLWLLILILLFAAVTFASHFLFPSVRWFFRRRMERAVARLNRRLARPIQPFKLAQRHDTIQRLIYDPEVGRAIAAHARSDKVPENVAFERARDYAREIVPAFSATAYFSIGTRLARKLSRGLYWIRLGKVSPEDLAVLDREAAVVFVINHRSNMDYVLVTWLAAGNSALSYAVGEWARVWPLSAVIRAMGAYFIRRGNRGALYRRVLERYVQMATAAGVTQAIFPEGGLSLDGRLAPPRLGLLGYIVEGAPAAGRDVIFVPVALNYDRVLEDRILLRAAATGQRRFRPPILTGLWGLVRHLWQTLTGRFLGFGTAAVSFGAPLSLRSMPGATPQMVASELMSRLARSMPVPPVPLIARHLLAADRPLPPATLELALAQDVALLSADGISVPRRTPLEILQDGLAVLGQRNVIEQGPEGISMKAGERALLAFYANSIAHHFERLSPAPPAASSSP